MTDCMKHLCHSETETAALANNIARNLVSNNVLLLSGPLGVGKSVFARALIRALCGDETLEVPSPTFTLLQTYESAKGPVFHYDLYRLKDPEEIYELGWEESLKDGITIVEWPERLGSLMPARRLDIRIANVKNSPDAREIEIIKTG